ncbi:hypothetical protein OG304_04905 [Streptomyces sp. NBC_00160]|uniref:2Fe-2S iron-sulfur cluster-binding protein n=1 Tax=Streptomyces sp. NBC_00160 TaxID=2903628 RepID=UPI002253F81E|nr:2Fe-2S iron-sulfur cluster-binding protein [Streptomyces sp. NBC_00160]MCX5302789.1 hypothetical protein [Streptomyces sp. NBC_00160]
MSTGGFRVGRVGRAGTPRLARAAKCFCGSCELRVLDGTPDHRDTVLSGDGRDRREVIYPCVSRARSPILTVDL